MAKKATRAKKTGPARKARGGDRCEGLRQRIAMVQDQLQELVDFLPEAPPSMRPSIRAAIARLRELLRRLLRALRECERQP
jgi:hypothetical protein